MAEDDTRPTAALIAEVLAREIRTGMIPLGEPLPAERELGERFGVSRPTVREALLSLQIRGFVTAGGGKRPRAARPSLMMILQETGLHLRDALGDTETGAYLEQMRQFIEAGAVREAARHAGSAQIGQLKAALDANHAAIGTAQFTATDIAFHQALVAILGNPVIDTLHRLFLSEALALRPARDDRLAADQASFAEHQAVFHALLAGNVADATDRLDAHLSRSYRSRLAQAASLPDTPAGDLS